MLIFGNIRQPARFALLQTRPPQIRRPITILLATSLAASLFACAESIAPRTAPTKGSLSEGDTYTYDDTTDVCAMYDCHDIDQQQSDYINAVAWSIQTEAAPECMGIRDEILSALGTDRIHVAMHFLSPTQTGATTHGPDYYPSMYIREDRLNEESENTELDIVHEGTHLYGMYWYYPHQQEADFKASQCLGYLQ